MRECDAIQPLMSGYLDGELTREEIETVERHVAECPSCREEFNKMKRMVDAVAGLRFEAPPDEVWETFLEGVYNRIERRTGWALFIIGLVALSVYGIYLFLTEPWCSALAKMMIATPLAGLAVLFVSVLRERLFVAKTDRYSREVQR